MIAIMESSASSQELGARRQRARRRARRGALLDRRQLPRTRRRPVRVPARHDPAPLHDPGQRGRVAHAARVESRAAADTGLRRPGSRAPRDRRGAAPPSPRLATTRRPALKPWLTGHPALALHALDHGPRQARGPGDRTHALALVDHRQQANLVDDATRSPDVRAARTRTPLPLDGPLHDDVALELGRRAAYSRNTSSCIAGLCPTSVDTLA